MTPRSAGSSAPAGADDPAERGVIEALLAVPETAGDVFEELDAGDFAGAKMRQLFELAKSLYDTEGHVNASRVLAEIEDPAAASFVSGVLDRPPRPEMGRAADDCVRQLLRRRSERELRQLRREYEAAKAAGNQPLADDLSARCLKLQQHLHREVLAR